MGLFWELSLSLQFSALLLTCHMKFQNSLGLIPVFLSWISQPPNTWKTFVRNRVAKIQTIVPSDRWGHVKGKNNPADLPSRGVTADVLLDSSLWWRGPEWLRDGSCNLNAHIGPQCLPKAQKIEEHQTPVLSLPLAATVQNSSVIEIINHSRFRSFKKGTRICLRHTFCENVESKCKDYSSFEGHRNPNCN